MCTTVQCTLYTRLNARSLVGRHQHVTQSRRLHASCVIIRSPATDIEKIYLKTIIALEHDNFAFEHDIFVRTRYFRSNAMFSRGNAMMFSKWFFLVCPSPLLRTIAITSTNTHCAACSKKQSTRVKKPTVATPRRLSTEPHATKCLVERARLC